MSTSSSPGHGSTRRSRCSRPRAVGRAARTAAELHGALRQGRLRRHDRRTRDRRPPHVRRRSVRSRHRRARPVRRARDDRHRWSHDPGAERRGPLPPRVLSHRAHQPPYHRVARCRADRRRHGSRRRCNARDRPQVARPGGRAACPRANARTFARRAHRSALLVGRAIPTRSLRGDSAPVRTRTGAAATRDRWRPASGRYAVFVRAIAYGAALLVPDRRYVAEREGTYVRRWVRAWSLARPSRSAP